MRAVLGGQPAKLHQALRELPFEGISTNRATSPSQTISARNGKAETFAELVKGSLEEGLLRYSARLELLGQAARLGVGRFEGNLIIAAVQHQTTPNHNQQKQRPPSGGAGERFRFKSAMPAAMIVLAMEGLIVLGALWIVAW